MAKKAALLMNALNRISYDVEDISKNPLPGICTKQSFADKKTMYVMMKGPEGTPYEGGFFYFFVNFPIDYPYGPPVARLASPDGYFDVLMNQHFFTDGTVGDCSVKGDLSCWPWWDPSMTLRDFLVRLTSLMEEEPFKGQPELNERIRYLTLRIFVCDMMESPKYYSPRIPAALRRAMKLSFLLKYDFYLNTCDEYTKKKKKRWIAKRSTTEDVFNYPFLKERLVKIKLVLDAEIAKHPLHPPPPPPPQEPHEQDMMMIDE